MGSEVTARDAEAGPGPRDFTAPMLIRSKVLSVLVMLGLATLIHNSPSHSRVEPISINQVNTDMANDETWQAGLPPAVSADGRFVAFSSMATDLAPGTDSNDNYDVFVRDRVMGTTEVITVNGAGTDTGNSFSINPTISNDGRFVAFRSGASDLVMVDTNGRNDVFVHDRVLNTTSLVSVNLTGSDSGDFDSVLPLLSADGSAIVFWSFAGDLVATDSNQTLDVFVRDLVADTTYLVTINAAGTDSGQGSNNTLSQVPAISADGRRIAFASDATDLIEGDTNGETDVFIRDLDTATTVLASAAFGTGATGNGRSTVPAISADGRVVAFASEAENLVPLDTNESTDFFVYDLNTASTELVSTSTGATGSVAGGAFALSPASLSSDGNLVAFNSFSDQLVSNDFNRTVDIFLRNRTTNTTTLVSTTPAGMAATGPSLFGSTFGPAFSADSRFLVFTSAAIDLTVPLSVNESSDVYLRDLVNETTILVSRTTTASGNANSFFSTLSADGSSVAFLSNATDLVPVDTNGLTDVFASDPPILLFADGFESGDTAAWTATVR